MESVIAADASFLEQTDTRKQELNANDSRAKIHSCLALLINLFAKMLEFELQAETYKAA